MCPHLPEELLAAKLFRVVDDLLRVEANFIEFFHGGDNRINRLLDKKDARRAFSHGFSCAPSTEGDNRAPASHCFDGNHAEILLSGKHESSTARVVMFEDVESL